MQIVVAHHNPASCERWREALARELPDVDVVVWNQGKSGDARYAIAWAAPPQSFFAEHPHLKAFFSTGAGVEKILASPDLPARLPIIRLEDAGMAPQMARYCVSAALDWTGHHATYAEQQRTQTWRQLPSEDLADWPVGVFGLGVLGTEVAHSFAALGFTVNGFSRTKHADARIRSFAESDGAGSFESFLAATRLLVILAPLTAATRDRFDHATLSRLRAGACVVNVARGELLVDDALLALLDSGHLGGAALDVFRQEPLPREHRFWTHPKIRLTPHISAITVIGLSAQQVAQKVRRLERGEVVSGIVDRTRGY